MEDIRFKEGQEVVSLWWGGDDSNVTVGISGVEKITVVMEDGQMSGVPWFAVWKNGKVTQKFNGALLEMVGLE